jgi:hypothetical protein
VWNRPYRGRAPPARHTHGLRHAHVSWQLAGGADLQIVKERLGHATITTTERCMHTLPGADEAALAALGPACAMTVRPTDVTSAHDVPPCLPGRGQQALTAVLPIGT